MSNENNGVRVVAEINPTVKVKTAVKEGRRWHGAEFNFEYDGLVYKGFFFGKENEQPEVLKKA